MKEGFVDLSKRWVLEFYSDVMDKNVMDTHTPQ